jgi:hypothetical protein
MNKAIVGKYILKIINCARSEIYIILFRIIETDRSLAIDYVQGNFFHKCLKA